MFHVRSLTVLLISTFLTASSSSAQLIFEDVSEEAGLDQFTYISNTYHDLGINWIDFDNDYDADLFVTTGTGGQTPHLYRNNGDSTFTLVDELLPSMPTDIDFAHSVFADFDNDGDSDIYIFVDNPHLTNLVRFNRQDGPPNILLKNLWIEQGGRILPGQPLFTEIAEQAGVADLADPPLGEDWPGMRAKTGGWLDYDRDGCIDLFVGHDIFGPISYGRRSVRNRLYRNRCDGTFEDTTASSGVDDGTDPLRFRPTLAFIGAHMDADLWPDMFVVNVEGSQPAFERDVFFVNNADGTFRDATADSAGLGDDSAAGMGIDVADIDLDGDWDIYISDLFNTRVDEPPPGNVLYLGKGDGTFADNSAPQAGVAAHSSWGVTFFDADQDAYEDLLVATMGQRAEPFMYRNMGDGTFADLTESSRMMSPDGRGTAVADYDGDGDLDPAIINDFDGVLSLYRNVAPLKGSWLRVRLRARQSNRSAIGALIKVKAGPYNMMRQVKGGSSAHSQDELVAHFGLRFEDVDQVRIYWPSGAEDVIQAVAPNQTITVTEGTTAASVPAIHAYPPYVDLGVVSEQAVSERTVRIFNEGAGPLTVTGLDFTDAAFSVVSPGTPFDLAPYGGVRDVVVRFSGGSPGLQKGSLLISSNDPETPVMAITLVGAGSSLYDRINPARGRMRRTSP
jgi:hypothetical protein